LLVIATLSNFRNVGGLSTVDGDRVSTGLLYRSGALDTLDGEDAARLAALGIRTIYDLRSEPERQVRPDRVPPGIEYVPLNMIRDVDQPTPARIMAALRDPLAAQEIFGEGRGRAMFIDHYREFVHLPSARRAVGRLFRELVDGEHRPALVHCMGGKDRTGWVAASLLLLLGVPADDVMADFLTSNDHLGPRLRGFMDDFQARGGDPELIMDTMWTRPEYLEASLEEMRRLFGTMERYFTHGLGLGGEIVGELRSLFLYER
jgi:protein-tyrosine phosphatase